MDNLWSMSIEKLMIWRAGYWSKYDSKTTNWVLRVAYDVLIIAANSKVFESLSMHSKIKGFYKGDILILIVSSPAQQVRKIKFQIKGDVTQCLKKLNQHFPILDHNSMSRNRVFESRYRNFGEVMIHAVETIAGVEDENIKDNIQKQVQELREMVIANNESESGYLAKMSTMAGISIRTLRTIKKEGSINEGEWNTPGKKRPRQPTVANLDNFDISAIRNKINEFYCVRKQVPTLKTLYVELKESIGFTGCRETLRKILHENGFEFKRNKEERSMLMESFEISGWRQRYLRTIHKKREEGKLIVYLDETYVHQNYRPKKSWQGPSTSLMDNASYHVTQMNKPPTKHSLKADIQKWLTENKIPYEECYKKTELMCLVEENKVGPIYEAEEILKQHGHEVLKLPPYHCDLNAIELIWSLAKRKVSSRNLGIHGSQTENLIRECFSMITADDWKRCTDHVINVEEKYRLKDDIVDIELAPFIIQLRDSDNESDDSLSGIEFLESDFDYDS